MAGPSLARSGDGGDVVGDGEGAGTPFERATAEEQHERVDDVREEERLQDDVRRAFAG